MCLYVSKLPLVSEHLLPPALQLFVLTFSSITDTKADLKRCYSELGLDPSRGVALGSYIRDYLRRPGNSIRVDEELRDEWKLKVLETAHKLLMSGNWALETFSRPAIKTTGCQNVTFPEDSTR